MLVAFSVISDPSMQNTLKAMAGVDVKLGLKTVLEKIEAACERRPAEFQYIKPQLVAVSKIKPVEAVIEAYEAGQRHFGENYVQELEEKSQNPFLLENCKDIKWHFIGHLQKNKINKVLSIPNLYLVETVHKEKLAENLNNNWPKFRTGDTKLKVMIQINTSGEDAKKGIPPEEAVSLTRFILDKCSNLELEGLMTIGMIGYDPKDGPNPDFLALRKCRDEVCKALGIDWKKMHLSMGMSTDYEQAIELGSTIVRVGTSIFGARPQKS